jgi:hypothetical protein
MGAVETTWKQQLLPIAVAQREAVIEPEAMAAELAGPAVLFVACGISRERHVSGLF